jgi:FkbM family methyltransferase
MTRQEVAVALSHIAVWKTVAASDLPYTLVLEDDVYFRRGFARTLDRAWAELMEGDEQAAAFDLLYLSFMEARMGADRVPVSELVFRPRRGLWCLSGYVLSAGGAQRLLDLLPVRGPVDLWINHQFENLDVIATQQSIIEQRLDCPSANSYSILPVLSKVGVLTRERPLLFKTRPLPGPVFEFGKHGSGLTALAMALSMLGYRGCSDVTVFLSKAVGDTGCVFGFEPAGETCLRLEENLRLNHIANARIFRLALGDYSGEADLYVGDDYLFANLIKPRSKDGAYQKIQVIEGDRLRETEKLPVPNALKIDVEGFEYSVLRGLTRTLASPACRIVSCEIHPTLLPSETTQEDIFQLLKAYGFDRLEARRSPEIPEFHVLATKD